MGMIKLSDPKQGSLFSIRSQFIEAVGPDSFYGLLALKCDHILADAVFEKLYCADNGRPCKSPGLLFRMLLLQMHDGCSDHETIERSRFDLRWKVALDLDLEGRPCVKSTLQEFRARIHLSEMGEVVFKRVLEDAKRVGLLKGGKLKVALDTTPVLGRGAVKDTYNLVADGIRKVATVLAQLDGLSPEEWGEKRDLRRFWEGSSLKGDANIDWSDEQERRVFLTRLVSDAQVVLLEADQCAKKVPQEQAALINEAASLLRRIISQDTTTEPDPPEPKRRTRGTPASEAASEVHPESAAVSVPDSGPTAEGGETSSQSLSEVEPAALGVEEAMSEAEEPWHATEATVVEAHEGTVTPAQDHVLGKMVRIINGVAPDRVVSITDPDARHGCKSASHRFNGHKLSVCVDTESGLILSMDVIAGNAPDKQGALNLVKEAEANTGCEVERAITDCAYGDGATRKQFKDAGIDLSAKVPSPPANNPYHKSRFLLDLTNRIATCPAGTKSGEYDYTSKKTDGQSVPVLRFLFPGEVCGACPHRDQCIKSPDRSQGRTVTLHPQEDLLQEARARQALPGFRDDVRARQTVEHRQARVIQIGGRKARYFGRAKTRLQYLLAGMVANLTLTGAFLGPLNTLTLAIIARPCLDLGKRPNHGLSTQKRAA